MKHILKFLFLAWLSTSTAWAGPVQMSEINGDAKWLLHLDVDKFRASKAGGYVIKQLIEPKIEPKLGELKEKLKLGIDPNQIIEKINSITIYGTDFKAPKENAVLMVKVEPDLQAAVVGLLAGFTLAGTNSPVQLTQEQVGNVTLYSQQKQISCAVLPGKELVWSASYDAARKAAEVLAGKAETLAVKKTFADFPDEKTGFFFLASAQGFNEDAALPPQAKLLQMADGGQLALGEDAEQMVLSLALKAKTPEIVSQMQQVVQGLIAMASLAHPEDKDIANLVQGVKVNATDKVVSVRVAYPVDKVIEKFNEQIQKKRHAMGVVERDRALEEQAKIVEQQMKLMQQQLKDAQKSGAEADQTDALKEQIKALKEEMAELKKQGKPKAAEKSDGDKAE